MSNPMVIVSVEGGIADVTVVHGEVWYTALVAVDLVKTTGRSRPDLRRYEGVCFVPRGRYRNVKHYANADGDILPRNARVVYRTRPRVARNEAYEQARSRTIHHNLYHGEDPAPRHLARYCHER